MRAFDDPGVLAQDPSLGRHDETVRVDAQADRPIGE
jgi:hypothetical protein